MHEYVLLVDPDRAALADIAGLLERRGYRAVLAFSFQEAERAMAHDPPAVLITELRLGAFNGLHLVIRGRAEGPTLAAIITTSLDDPVLKAEALRHDAGWLSKPVDASELLALVSHKLAHARHTRHWLRKPVGRRLLAARVVNRRARVVDVSYGGLRFEVQAVRADELAAAFEVHLPVFGLSVRAQPVWTSRLPSGWLSCGAAVADSDHTRVSAWRRAVDTIGSTTVRRMFREA